jgi:anhydro-N-acetylmuramic acid kinase
MQKLIYNAIGLMSGTSLDGLDIALCQFEKSPNNKWKWDILEAVTKSYPNKIKSKLKEAIRLSSLDLNLLDVELGKWMGQTVNGFIEQSKWNVDFIASHGHTVFHLPEKQLTLQIGNPNFICAITQLPVISDFRTLDLAKGGQGAPLVPIGDELLFSEYEFCINLGGIANLSFQNKSNERIAYDICVCNILLNTLANHENLEYDDKGMIAKSGKVIPQLLKQWNAFAFLKKDYPKSLGIESIEPEILAKINLSKYSIEDMLATAIEHIATHISNALRSAKNNGMVLLTGGGAFNDFLIEKIQSMLHQDFKLIVADQKLVNYKEALIFAFLGVLNVRNEFNTLSSVTGAHSNSVSGQKLGNI